MIDWQALTDKPVSLTPAGAKFLVDNPVGVSSLHHVLVQASITIVSVIQL